MTEEQTHATPTTEAAPGKGEPAAVAVPGWRELIKGVDPKELASDPLIAGIVGSKLDSERKREEAGRVAKARADARAEVDNDLMRLFDENPDTLKEQYPKVFEHLSQVKLEQKEGESLKKFAARVGRAYSDLPEWNEATPEEKQGLVEALAGVSDEDVIARANSYALDLTARKRADKLYTERHKADMEKERKAWETERAGNDLKASDHPDLTRGTAGGKVNVSAMSDEEFENYWKKLKTPGRRT
jgi:hypothetical protein